MILFSTEAEVPYFGQKKVLLIYPGMSYGWYMSDENNYISSSSLENVIEIIFFLFLVSNRDKSQCFGESGPFSMYRRPRSASNCTEKLKIDAVLHVSGYKSKPSWMKSPIRIRDFH